MLDARLAEAVPVNSVLGLHEHIRTRHVGRTPSSAADPLVRPTFPENSTHPAHYLNEMFYHRRLPHISVTGRPVFLTWRLHGSLPRGRHFAGGTLPSGQAFAALDRLLDEARTGPRFLLLPELARMMVEALEYNQFVLKHYDLHAYAVMPNHVHLLLTAHVPLPKVTKSIKGITAKRANEMLGRTGTPFWQEESYDRVVRDDCEFLRIWRYIEMNPVRAGLAREAGAFGWSSAGRREGATGGAPPGRTEGAARGSPAAQESRPAAG